MENLIRKQITHQQVIKIQSVLVPPIWHSGKSKGWEPNVGGFVSASGTWSARQPWEAMTLGSFLRRTQMIKDLTCGMDRKLDDSVIWKSQWYS